MTDLDRRTANRHPHIRDAVREIMGQYAVRDITGRVVVCWPKPVEVVMHPRGYPAWSGNNGKVCYPDMGAAQAAADAIAQVDGADQVSAYPCPRGGHAHTVALYRARERWEATVCRIALAAERARKRAR